MGEVPQTLLNLVARALAQSPAGPGGDAAAITPEQAESLWQRWCALADEGQRRREIEALAQAHWEQMHPLVERVFSEVGSAGSAPGQQARAYLLDLADSIRRRLRRPEDVEGRTLPANWPLRQATDLLELLPRRSPAFSAGDRPDGVGGWVLAELIEVGDFGETWKAQSLHAPDAPAALLRFCLNRAAQEKLARPETTVDGADLGRVLQEVQHPGLLLPRRLHLRAQPPCLEYNFVAAAPLTILISGWQRGAPGPVVSALVEQIADALGALHRLDPPLVHRGLQASSIVVDERENGTLRAHITDAGLAALASRRELASAAERDVGRRPADADPLVFASPQELRGELPQPRDDVYALGILWYQMLTGNPGAGRPGGSQWRRRLVETGLSTETVELLESCFEDDPFYRPADGAELAERLRRLAAPPTRPAAPRRNVLDEILSGSPAAPAADAGDSESAGPGAAATRVRQRRADVWQLFDTLEQKAPELAKLVTNGLGMKLVLVPAGSFQMGTPPQEAGVRENELPRHEVTLTQPFYLAVHPVSQQQYQRLLGDNPARFHADNGGSPEHPVESVTWEQAVEFCRRLSELPEEMQAGRRYRLPTEAEWEYACRAGTDTPFGCGEALSSAQANFDGNFPYGNAPKGRYLQKTSRVGQFPPNNFGLCDMHGNVWEWCADWFDAAYYEWSPKRDPAGPGEGHYRVLRGGSWKNHAVTCRSGYRNALRPTLKDGATGFRVCCNAAAADPANREFATHAKDTAGRR